MKHVLIGAALLLAAPCGATPPPATVLAAALAAHDAGRFAEARHGFRALADQGSAIGETMLGVIYAHGQGVTPDPATAVSYWFRAANRGYAPAQLALARALAAGTGVAPDATEAWLWASLAARGGDEPMASAARTLATELRRGMAPGDARSLDRRLAAWRPWASAGE